MVFGRISSRTRISLSNILLREILILSSSYLFSPITPSYFDDLNFSICRHFSTPSTLTIHPLSQQKTTDKSILTLLESNSLQSLDLSSVEGRLTKKLWSKISLLSDEFTTLKISFEEKGHHHTWVTDHLNSLFEIFPATTNGLRVLSVTRIYPLDEKVNNGTSRIGNAGGVGNGNGINSLGLGIGISQPLSNYPEPSVGSIQNQNQIQSPSTLGLYSPGSNQNSGDNTTLPPCNDVVSPRPFPKEGLVALGEYGRSLVTLEVSLISDRITERGRLRSSSRHCRRQGGIR